MRPMQALLSAIASMDSVPSAHLAPQQPLNWVLQCRSEGRTETRLMAGSVPESHVVADSGVRFWGACAQGAGL